MISREKLTILHIGNSGACDGSSTVPDTAKELATKLKGAIPKRSDIELLTTRDPKTGRDAVVVVQNGQVGEIFIVGKK